MVPERAARLAIDLRHLGVKIEAYDARQDVTGALAVRASSIPGYFPVMLSVPGSAAAKFPVGRAGKLVRKHLIGKGFSALSRSILRSKIFLPGFSRKTGKAARLAPHLLPAQRAAWALAGRLALAPYLAAVDEDVFDAGRGGRRRF